MRAAASSCQAGVPEELPEAVAYEVAHPALQIVQAGSHAFEAGRLALGCGGGIGGLALVFLLLLLTRGAFFACVKPFLYPIGASPCVKAASCWTRSRSRPGNACREISGSGQVHLKTGPDRSASTW